VPAVSILVAMQVLAETRKEFLATSRLLKGCLSLGGIFVLLFVLRQAVIHCGEVVSLAHLREFLLPLILMTAFVPFLYAWRYLKTMQTALHMTKFGFRDDPKLFVFARGRIVRAVGLSLQRAELFESRFRGRLWRLTTTSDILAVLRDFGTASTHAPDDSD